MKLLVLIFLMFTCTSLKAQGNIFQCPDSLLQFECKKIVINRMEDFNMIRSVIQYGSILDVRDEQDRNIGTLAIGNGEFLGYSSRFILVRYDNMIVSMDENQYNLGHEIFPEHYIIKGITESGFIAQTGSIQLLYDPYCNHVGTQSI